MPLVEDSQNHHPHPSDDDPVDVLVIGAGQAGLAVSAHLRTHGVAHLVVERSGAVADRWRSERWDSLRQNGPCGHDRFPVAEFPPEVGGPDAFASKDQVAAYFWAFAEKIKAPVRFGVEIVRLTKTPGGGRGSDFFRAETAERQVLTARRVVVATGSFQRPSIPDVVPPARAPPGLVQLHSSQYKNPGQLPPGGAVLVVGAGSSGAQIADELLRAGGRRVYLAVGRHQRPPRRYRGRDITWWLQVLGLWDVKNSSEDADEDGKKHVSIAVSGVHGGRTIDYREFASRGMVLVGHLEGFDEENNKKILRFAPDLRDNIEAGDRGYLGILHKADAYVAREGLEDELPADPDAYRLSSLPDDAPEPPCLAQPLRALDLGEAGLASIVWATGFARDFSWVQIEGAVAAHGRPAHQEGVSTTVPGMYFVGLPFLRNRASSFIFGVWKDAELIAQRIARDAGSAL